MSKPGLEPTRRAVLATGIASGAVAAGTSSVSADSASAKIEIFPEELLGTISADNFGYLLEVIGTSVYDGVWVGEESRIANIGGIRADLVAHLRRINTSVIRWPGGCFADGYDWRDGIGPRKSRPIRTSIWNDSFPQNVPNGPQRFDPNLFGTNEFIRLCRLTGGRPLLNANTRGLPPNDFDRWVEYCNSPSGSTTLAKVRAEGGSAEPYKVRYWGIGNEPWGMDGAMTVEAYGEIYKRFVSMVPDYGVKPLFLACGTPPGTSLEWVEKLIEIKNRSLLPIPMEWISIHHYAGLPLNDFAPADTVNKMITRDHLTSVDDIEMPDALHFNEAQWYDMLNRYDEIDAYIQHHWDVMAVGDPNHQVKLAVDEWGAICRNGTELSSANYWSRAVTLRDVIGAALTIDILNRHSDKISLACFTGLINQEGGLFLTDGAKFLATGIYHVFKMYSTHQGGHQIRARFESPAIGYTYQGKGRSIWGLNGSASIKGKTITLTAVNPHATEPRETIISVRNGQIKQARLEMLTHHDIHAYNTFEAPQTLIAVEKPVVVKGSSSTCVIPPASVSKFTFEVA